MPPTADTSETGDGPRTGRQLDHHRPSRRRVLGALGTGVASLAGCLDLAPGGSHAPAAERSDDSATDHDSTDGADQEVEGGHDEPTPGEVGDRGDETRDGETTNVGGTRDGAERTTVGDDTGDPPPFRLEYDSGETTIRLLWTDRELVARYLYIRRETLSAPWHELEGTPVDPHARVTVGETATTRALEPGDAVTVSYEREDTVTLAVLTVPAGSQC